MASSRLLIVEDEKPMARALELKFTHAGFAPLVVGDGEAAVRALEQNKFAAVLLDLILPKMDGFAVLDWLRKKGSQTPVVVTSNLGQAEDKERARTLGAKGYFVKSNTPISQLVEEVKKIIA